MTQPPGGPGQEPGQQPFGPVDPQSGAYEYPPLQDSPPQPPGQSMPPPPPYGGYVPPQNYPPPPGYGPPAAYPPPPGGYPPPPGPYPPAGYGPAKTNSMATTSLVCGLVSLPGYTFCFLPGFLLAIVAVTVGIVAMTQINKSPGERGREMAIAGIVIGALGFLGGGSLIFLGMLPSL